MLGILRDADSGFEARAMGMIVELGQRRVREAGKRERAGQALRQLRHAVEYLADARLFAGGAAPEHQAMRILQRASREVFVGVGDC